MANKTFSIYRASAGTGKTFTLVKEFLKLLILHPESYRKLLAITFTNKAAAEMKERVLNNLHGIVEQSTHPKIVSMMNDLKQELNLSDLDLQTKAQTALNNILHDYSSFSISTIDSFTAKIVKTFARELGLQPNFEVELDSDFFINEAIDVIIAKVGRDKSITQILTDFVQNNLDDERNYKIENNLYDFVHETWKESGVDERKKLEKLSAEDLIKAGKTIREKAKNLEKQITTTACPIWEQISQNDYVSCMYKKEQGIAGYFKHYSNSTDIKHPGKNVLESVENGKWQSNDGKKIKELPPSFVNEMHSAYQKIEEIVPNLILYRLIVKDLYSVSLLNEINKTINELYDETGKVFIAEFNKRISDIIKEEPVPFIYERIGTKYENFFIDEFQDTSDLQWTNLAPLISNSLSSGNFNMIVGDGKQAIYRWRNGNVELFERLSTLQNMKNIDNEQDEFLSVFSITKTLQRNFRSEKNIIDFNNKLFDYVNDKVLYNLSEKLKNVYFDQEESANSNEDKGFVKIKLLQKNEEEKSSEMVCKEILEIIRKLEEQGFNRGDIAILARKNKTLSMIAEYLTENHVPISSAESLLLHKNQNVNLLCSLIRYTADKELISDKFYILLWVLQQKKISENYHSLFLQVKNMNVNEFQQFLNKQGLSVDFQKSAALPLLDIVTDYIIDFKLDISDPYIRFFMDSLMEIVNSERLSLFGFKDWWEEKGLKLSLPISEVPNSVKMLSIHKAKGLEFPIVILPFLNEKENNTPDKRWVDLATADMDKDIELPVALLPLTNELIYTKFGKLQTEEKEKKILDMLNVLYVACTRPEKGLFILTEKIQKDEAKLLENPSIPKILNAFVQANTLDQTDEFEKGSFPVHDEEDNVQQQKNDDHEAFSFTPWRQKIELLHSKNPDSIFFNSESIRYGKMVHAALEHIITLSDIDRSVSQLSQSGIVSENEIEPLTECLNRIVSHSLLKSYFSTDVKVLTEADLLLPKETVSLRPDRIVINGEELVIIDYKTGKSKKADEEQVKKYAETLGEMGFYVKHGFLVYLGSDDREIMVKDVL